MKWYVSGCSKQDRLHDKIKRLDKKAVFVPVQFVSDKYTVCYKHPLLWPSPPSMGDTFFCRGFSNDNEEEVFDGKWRVVARHLAPSGPSSEKPTGILILEVQLLDSNAEQLKKEKSELAEAVIPANNCDCGELQYFCCRIKDVFLHSRI